MNAAANSKTRFRQILGIRFFTGDVYEAISMMKDGGLLVVPAAPALKNLPQDTEYREALLNSDVAITDSAMMVLVWNMLQGDKVRRLSGLEYFSELVKEPDLQVAGGSFWIMANEGSAATNVRWLREQSISVSEEDVYIAPFYPGTVSDPALLEILRERKPKNIILTIGGGNQERLGLYLKRNLDYAPSIHCVGAAIAFLSGDQVFIPMWADRFKLGWLFRCVSSPGLYLPRYWGARALLGLLVKYRDQLPMES
jgi:N-acetylglucosaminyldiphosphoundecaprenol N-acetyl-beta-D-mannosaminyltransferase